MFLSLNLTAVPVQLADIMHAFVKQEERKEIDKTCAYAHPDSRYDQKRSGIPSLIFHRFPCRRDE